MNDKLSGKYLTFQLDEEEYGIAIIKVREIIGMIEVTPVPQTPDFIKGVINLRGRVIPVADLRSRFEIDSVAPSERTCIIVVELGIDSVRVPIGIIVDSVSEVRNIKEQEIENTPSFGVKLNTDYILGMAKLDDKVKILLDIDRVLTSEEASHMLQSA